MKYHLHIPLPPTLDPRKRTFDSLEAFTGAAPEVEVALSADTEMACILELRKRWPNAIVMPIPVELGSGSTIMLGVLPTVRGGVERGAEIPFVAFVRAQAENEADKKLFRKEAHRMIFDPSVWKTPLDEPSSSFPMRTNIEMRSTDLDLPIMIDADVGRNANGELVIAFDVGGGRASLTFPVAAGISAVAAGAK
jgi:hypothetical protein